MDVQMKLAIEKGHKRKKGQTVHETVKMCTKTNRRKTKGSEKRKNFLLCRKTTYCVSKK